MLRRAHGGQLSVRAPTRSAWDGDEMAEMGVTRNSGVLDHCRKDMASMEHKDFVEKLRTMLSE